MSEDENAAAKVVCCFCWGGFVVVVFLRVFFSQGRPVEERLKNNVFVFLAAVDNNSAFLYLFALRFAGNASVK